MPYVNGKKFPYTPEGKTAAAKAAKRKSKPKPDFPNSKWRRWSKFETQKSMVNGDIKTHPSIALLLQ